MITIKRIVIFGSLILLLIWGAILYLAFSDHSYHLFVPKLSSISSISSSEKPSGIDFSQNGPWKQDLFMATGNLSSFDGKAFIAHGTATPSAVVKNDQILVFFNYFPQSQRSAFGTINLVKSSSNGREWSKPTPVVFSKLPSFSTTLSSPKVVLMPNGKIKLYFLAKENNQNRAKMYAAVSDDGEYFVFDPGTSFEIENESLTAITLTLLDDKMHILAYTQEGAVSNNSYHAISYDSKVFTRLADISIKDSYYGQTDLVTEGDSLKLIGNSAKGLWSSSSKDGNSWGTPSYLSFKAENPGITKLGENYLLFYTGVTSPEND